MALQRDFALYERLHLNFRVDAFNIFNHPNASAGNIDTNLGHTTFGQSVGNNLQTIGVPNQLYAMGAPRSFQVMLKLQF